MQFLVVFPLYANQSQAYFAVDVEFSDCVKVKQENVGQYLSFFAVSPRRPNNEFSFKGKLLRINTSEECTLTFILTNREKRQIDSLKKTAKPIFQIRGLIEDPDSIRMGDPSKKK